jgi:hypothetical protein
MNNLVLLLLIGVALLLVYGVIGWLAGQRDQPLLLNPSATSA